MRGMVKFMASTIVAAAAVAGLGAQVDGDAGQYFPGTKDKADASYQVVKPQDAAFVYEGRFNFKKPDAPSADWQASRVRIDFEGQKLALLLEPQGNQVFLDAEIDGVSRIVALKARIGRYVLQDALPGGRHSLVLFKRSEASAGGFKFKGIEIDAGAKVFKPEVKYSSRAIFFGDSITVGACNEDGATDQWDKLITHNSAKSWAAMTAKAFNADHQNIAVSGMGMVTGWNTAVFAPQVWDRLGFQPTGPQADLQSWIPDAVFINLGENDGSYSSAQNQPFPATFAEVYKTYVKNIRQAWPKAKIVLLRGGMYNGSSNPDLIAAWDDVVASFAGDSLVYSYAFDHHSGNHPRVSDDRIMADELIAFIKAGKILP